MQDPSQDPFKGGSMLTVEVDEPLVLRQDVEPDVPVQLPQAHGAGGPPMYLALVQF